MRSDWYTPMTFLLFASCDLLVKSSKLHEGVKSSGSHTFIDHESISLNGIYLYTIKIGNEIKTTHAISEN
jgi:hypothetical protein